VRGICLIQYFGGIFFILFLGFWISFNVLFDIIKFLILDPSRYCENGTWQDLTGMECQTEFCQGKKRGKKKKKKRRKRWIDFKNFNFLLVGMENETLVLPDASAGTTVNGSCGSFYTSKAGNGLYF